MSARTVFLGMLRPALDRNRDVLWICVRRKRSLSESSRRVVTRAKPLVVVDLVLDRYLATSIRLSDQFVPELCEVVDRDTQRRGLFERAERLWHRRLIVLRLVDASHRLTKVASWRRSATSS